MSNRAHSLHYRYLVSNNTRLGLVLEGLVSVEQLQQLVSTQVAAALVCCLTVQKSSLQNKPSSHTKKRQRRREDVGLSGID